MYCVQMCNTFEWHFKQNHFCQIGRGHPVQKKSALGANSFGLVQGGKANFAGSKTCKFWACKWKYGSKFKPYK